MLRLHNDDFDDIPETYPFPVEESRAISTRVATIDVDTDRGTCEAARRVEAALRGVELKLDSLRAIMGYDQDPDRPRAA
jgi:hypothetical protein